MIASKRWAYHFVSQLECVNCRKDFGLKLYRWDGTVVHSEDMTIEELKSELPTIDVFCEECAKKGMTHFRMRTSGRLEHKREAAKMADLRSGAQVPSRYDQYRLENGLLLTKSQLVGKIRETQKCMSCHQQFAPSEMEFHHVDQAQKRTAVANMIYTSWTIQDLIDEIEKCTLLCSSCHKRVHLNEIDPPMQKICLDGNFFKYFA